MLTERAMARDTSRASNLHNILYNRATSPRNQNHIEFDMAVPASASDLIAYNANCHCGAVTLTVRIPSLSALEVFSCNCSICTRNGYLMVYPERKNVVFHTGLDNMTDFRFGKQVGVHRFCKTCGSSVSGEMKTDEMDLIAINVSLCMVSVLF